MNTHVIDSEATHDNSEKQPNVSRTDSFVDLLGATSRHIALLAAWIAMSGSLFFSEVLGWIPCLLCWYQRILMYPLAIILAVGIFRRDPKIHWYVLPFSVVGAGVSLYHYLLIKTDWFPPPPCTEGVSCSVDYIDWLGFINIPLMALTAFLIITCMMVVWATIQPTEEEIILDDLAEESADADEYQTPPTAWFDGSRLATVMIIVSVVLAFVLGSTFV